MFYVYEWYVEETGEIFYVGKGCRNRYKNLHQKNRMFRLYLEKFNCKNRIIKEFENEDDAFKYEYQRIEELKAHNLAQCNKNRGGSGGYSKTWNKEKKEYQSKYNPMKAFEQRERMKKNNPMKNKDVSKKVAKKTKRKVILNGIEYSGVLEASKLVHHSANSIIKWCNRGFDMNGNPCRYSNEPQKEIPLLKKLHPLANNQKAVIVDGVRYETVSDAAKALDGWSECLSRAIKHNRKYKGHTCSYANQQPSANLND